MATGDNLGMKKSPKKKDVQGWSVLTILIETALWVAVLILFCSALVNASAATVDGTGSPASRYLIGSAFLVYSVIYIYFIFFGRYKGRLFAIANGVSAALLVAIGVVTLVLPDSIPLWIASPIVFYSILALRRIPHFIAFRTARSILCNIMLLLVLGVMILISVGAPEWFELALLGMIVSIVAIIGIAFSRIRLKVLLKIMRKTYVGEIFFGLFTLMAVFSYVFFMLEPTVFKSYGDALWYSFAVITTIGFGDFAAIGLPCRILSVILGIYGIIVVAAITSVIVNFYTESTKMEATLGELSETHEKESSEKDKKPDEE